MGKKKKKRAENNPEAILARAQKLFHKKNYLLAERAYEEAARMIGREGLREKIAICRRETEKSRAEDLVKRAKKLARSGNPQEALAGFQEAYEVLQEDWLLQKIVYLKGVVQNLDAAQEAREAEASGQYLKAAGLYEQASANHEKEEMVGKQAACLIKGGDYEAAVSALERLPLKDPAQWYGYGFSLLRTGKYEQCLKAWDNIPSLQEDFLKQKALIRDLLVSDLFDRFERKSDPGKIYEAAKYLLHAGYENAGLSELMRECAISWIESLWKDEAYGTIQGLLADLALSRWDAAFLDLHAKVSFKLAEASTGGVGDLAVYWLSAVFSGGLDGGRGPIQGDEAVRDLLIQKGENLIERYAASNGDAGEKIRAQWRLEKNVIGNLYALVNDRGASDLTICTPSLASALGKAGQLSEFIQMNHDFFDDTEQYLITGCCYSPAWESFSRLSAGDFETAFEVLPPSNADDPFINYGAGRVLFAYGLSCMDKGKRPPAEYAQAVASLITVFPEYEDQLLEKALKTEDIESLRAYEASLEELRAARSSKALNDALSLVMSTRAMAMHLEGRLNTALLTQSLRKALEINPNNEHARGLLEDAGVNQEIMELEKALFRNKMTRACKIARESENDEVRKSFFKFMEGVLAELEGETSSDGEAIIILKDMLRWCASVDSEHDILFDIEDMIEELEGG